MNLTRWIAIIAVAASALSVTPFVSAQSEAAATAPTAASSGVTRQDRKAARAGNRRLERSVLSALSKSGDVDVSRVKVLVKGSTVTLTGSVPEFQQIARSAQVAKGVKGATSVVNKLIVATPGS